MIYGHNSDITKQGLNYTMANEDATVGFLQKGTGILDKGPAIKSTRFYSKDLKIIIHLNYQSAPGEKNR